MSYVVEFNSTFTKNLPGRTFIDWATDVSYADLNGLFPEIAEADWPTVKAGILATINSGNPVVGETPGLANVTKTATTTSSNITLTFANLTDYQTYADHCTAVSDKGLRLGFAFELAEKAVESSMSIDGRAITYDGTTTITTPPVAVWLHATYQLHYGVVKSCVHTTT